MREEATPWSSAAFAAAAGITAAAWGLMSWGGVSFGQDQRRREEPRHSGGYADASTWWLSSR